MIDRNKINSKIKIPIFAVELLLSEVSKNLDCYKTEETRSSNKNNFAKYVPISEFPSSSRDLSFSIKDYTEVIKLQDAINSLEVRFLKNFFIFDFFENKKNNEIKMGYRFIFESKDKTLTDQEIEKSITIILEKALSIKSITLPIA